jgi:hypothetical protein
MRRTENSSGMALITDGLPPGGTSFREVSVPNPQKHRTTTATVEPGRLRLILDRLQNGFYQDGPASERIATAVLADLKDLDESPPALPH